MKRFLPAFSVLAVIFLSIACTQESAQPDPFDSYDSKHKAKITVNRDSWNPESDTAQATLRVSSTYLWKIEIPEDAQDWLSAEPMRGDSNTTYKVKLHVTENTTETERSTKLVVYSGKAKKTIEINQSRPPRTIDPSTVDTEKIYIPDEFRNMNFFKSNSRWYYGRSKQSDHFIVFWEAGDYWDEYGTNTPSDSKSASYKVDIDDLLAKAELFYETNITKLKFADTGSGKSYLDKYKMIIMLMYQTEWLATGSGYDNTIGALWVSPNTCQPAGSTIAHEIGHSFQYQVYCDHLLNGGKDDSKSGWRYGFGGNGGNAFWEQTAQWQSFQPYPNEIFSNYYFQGYLDCAHEHIFHEDPRYSNYFIHWYWTDKYGIEEVARLWKESYSPEDPAETYMRLHGMTVGQFNDDIFEYGRRMVTWDVSALRTLGKSYIGKHTWKYTKDGDYYKVTKAKCPQSYGYNVITLKNAAGKTVTADFIGITDDSGYNILKAYQAGWRYGFVAYCSDGSRVYSDIFSAAEGQATFEVPANCSKLWFVVSGTPTVYTRHAWDDDASNDEQWPYKVKFTNTSVN